MRRAPFAAGVIAAVGLLAGCSSSHQATNKLRASIHVTIDRGHRGSVQYALLCPSAKGDFPDAATACKKLTSNDAMLHPPKMTATCAGSEGVPPSVTVKGRANGEPVVFSVRSCDAPSDRAQAARDWLALVPRRISSRANRAVARVFAVNRHGKSQGFPWFPRHVGTKACVLPFSVAGRVRAHCSTSVTSDPRGGMVVTFSEAWPSNKFRYSGTPRNRTLHHWWRFVVLPSGQVLAHGDGVISHRSPRLERPARTS